MILLDSAFAHVSEVSVLMFVCVHEHTWGRQNEQITMQNRLQASGVQLSPVPICAYGTVNGQTELASMSL